MAQIKKKQPEHWTDQITINQYIENIILMLMAKILVSFFYHNYYDAGWFISIGFDSIWYRTANDRVVIVSGW